MTSPNKQTPMMYVRKANVERMMMKESDFVGLNMLVQRVHRELKEFSKRTNGIAKKADVLAKGLKSSKPKNPIAKIRDVIGGRRSSDNRMHKQAMKIKEDAKQLVENMEGLLGNDNNTPSPKPRFSPRKSPSKSPKKSTSSPIKPKKSPSKSPKKAKSK